MHAMQAQTVRRRGTWSGWHVVGAGALLAGVVAALWLAWRVRPERRPVFSNVDFYAYYLAGAQVRLGVARDLMYPPIQPWQGSIPWMTSVGSDELERTNRLLPVPLHLPLSTTRYIYPPLLAVTVAPLTRLPPDEAAARWRSLLLGLSCAACWGLHRTLVRVLRVRASAALGILVACVATWPFLYGIRMAQASVLVFASTSLAIWALSAGRAHWAGIALGLGVLYKVTPVVVLVVFWPAALRAVLFWSLGTIAVGTALTSLFVSPLDFVRFSTAMATYSHQLVGDPNIQSIAGFVAHLWLTPDERSRLVNDPALLPVVARVVAGVAGAVFVAGAVWLYARQRRHGHEGLSSPSLILDVAGLSLVPVIATPVTQPHLYAVGLAAYALWLGTLVTGGRWRGWRTWLGAAALQILWVVPPTALPPTLGTWPPARLLLHPTLLVGLATMVLAWRAARGTPPMTGPPLSG